MILEGAFRPMYLNKIMGRTPLLFFLLIRLFRQQLVQEIQELAVSMSHSGVRPLRLVRTCHRTVKARIVRPGEILVLIAIRQMFRA